MDIKVQQQDALLDLRRDDGFFEMDTAQCRSAGEALAESYRTARPYPSIVIDKLVPVEFLRLVNSEFPTPKSGRFDDEFSQLKTGYSRSQIRSAYIHDLFSCLNSSPFLVFLEKMTGVKGLLPDPHFVGGGLHETRRGGHLSIHADFNIHPRTKLRRRLNLILFLNEAWEEQWGGKLELWDQRMTACCRSVVPDIGRAVVFHTDSANYHGHPDPLNCPPEVTRRSIALYYYTAPAGIVLPHTTVFKARPNSNDNRSSLYSRIRDVAARLRPGYQPED